ncbi:MAG: type II secretion system protein GspJ [Planctomycetota bacterium]
MAGFTLLELLLAVAVTGILAAGLFAGLGVVFDARAAAEGQLSGQAEARIALNMIRDQLIGAAIPDGSWVEDFLGEDGDTRRGEPADTLTFTTSSLALPTGNLRGDRHRVELALIEAEDDGPDAGTYLLAQRVTDDIRPDLGTSGGIGLPEDESVVQVLMRRVDSLSLRYYDGANWRGSWDAAQLENNLPRAVEVILVLSPTEDEAQRDRVDGSDRRRRFVRMIQLPMSTLEARGF